MSTTPDETPTPPLCGECKRTMTPEARPDPAVIPWWKRAQPGPTPKWASPTAVRRFRLKNATLPERYTARTERADG